MANKKISALTDGGDLQAGDLLVVARSGLNYKISIVWARLKALLGLALNAYDYGVTFDGSTDDTAAWQAVFNELVARNGGMIVGIPPAGYGTSKINGTITVPWGTFWKLYAPGLTFLQAADNTPHLTITNTPYGSRSSVGWVIEGPMWFTWANQQVTTVATQGVLSGTGTGTFTVASAGPFPSGSITIMIDKEQINGSFSGTTFTITGRGANSTTAVSHSAGATVYPVGMTSACAVYIAADATHPNYSNFQIEKVGMGNGSYLLGCSSSNTGVWGYAIRDYYLDSTVVGGLVSNTATVEGQPNNKIEDGYILANSMVGPILDWQGSQSTWITGMEINNSALAPVIIRSQGKGSITIGTLKSEIGNYDSRNSGAMFQLANELFEARYLRLQGMNYDLTNMSATQTVLFRRSGGTSAAGVHIGTLDFVGDYFLGTNNQIGATINGWTITNGTLYLTDSSTTMGLFSVEQLYCPPVRNFYVMNASNAGSQDAFYIVDANRGRVSADKGDADSSWLPLGVCATSTLSLSSGTNPADGDTVVISGALSQNVTYRFKNTLAAANDVKIGADFAATLASLVHAINGDGTPGTDYFAGTQWLPLVSATSSGAGAAATMVCTATNGPIGNAFVSTATGSVLSWSGATFSGGLQPENIISYETALTANRTVTLPNQLTSVATNLFNGARVRIVRSGGGNFDLIIKRATTEMARIYAGQTGSIEYVFRRNKWVEVSRNITSAAQALLQTNTGITGTTDTTGKMMGLNAPITPVRTGQVLVTVSGTIYNPTAIGDGAKVQIRYGTGTAPTNGAALTGTAIGQTPTYIAATTAEKAPFSVTALIQNATIGTALWIDVGLAAITGGTATIDNVTVAAVEL